MHDVWWRAEDAPVVGNDPRWRIEIVSKSEHIVHMQFETHTHTYRYITRYITDTRARLRLRWGEIWGSFHVLSTKIRGTGRWMVRQISFQLAVTSWWDCPCFCLAESCFSRKASLQLRGHLLLKGENLLLGRIFTGKHQQFESTLSEIGR